MLFYKIIRKLRQSWHKWLAGFRLSSYQVLSRHRFVLASTLVTGKRFSINTDLTLTSLAIKDNCRIRDNFNITIGNNGRLSIGENCFFNNNCSITCLGTIEIGNNNQFGEVVLFYDHDHVFADNTKLISQQGYTVGTIKIGNNCWVGSNVVILKNVTIGDNVVIGAGCIIHTSIPANTRVVCHQDLLMKPI